MNQLLEMLRAMQSGNLSGAARFAAEVAGKICEHSIPSLTRISALTTARAGGEKVVGRQTRARPYGAGIRTVGRSHGLHTWSRRFNALIETLWSDD